MKLVQCAVTLFIISAVHLTYGSDQISLDFISDAIETIHGYPLFEYLANTDISELLCRGAKLLSPSEISDGVNTCKSSQSKEGCRAMCLFQHLQIVNKKNDDLGVPLSEADASIDKHFPSKVSSDLKLAIRMCESKLGKTLDTETGCEDNMKFVDCIQVVLVQVCDMRILPKPKLLLGKALTGQTPAQEKN